MYIVGRLCDGPVVEDESLLGASADVQAEVGGVAGGQSRKPRVTGAREVDGQTLTVGAGEPSRTLTPDQGKKGLRSVFGLISKP